MSHNALEPKKDELQRIFLQKHGDPNKTWSSPRSRRFFGYYTPDEYYEAVVSKLVDTDTSWIDVGGGRDLFPDNSPLAAELAARCRQLVAVDPSDTVEDNQFAKHTFKKRIEEFTSRETFDLATLRMVAEHIAVPESCVASLQRLVKPNGKVVV